MIYHIILYPQLDLLDCREQIKCPAVQWSFFEATGRLYGRGATEAGSEVGSIRKYVHDVVGASSDAGAGGGDARGLRAHVPDTPGSGGEGVGGSGDHEDGGGEPVCAGDLPAGFQRRVRPSAEGGPRGVRAAGGRTRTWTRSCVRASPIVNLVSIKTSMISNNLTVGMLPY